MAIDLVERKEKLLALVKMKGPMLPIDASKAIGMDSVFTGAMLSELASSKKIKITNVKIGGSPLYYVDGQETKLQDLMKYLNGKDKEVAEKLRAEKLVRDNDCKPLERVSLRQIKDYAIPIRITNNNEIETFWRWYLYKEEEAKNRIVELFAPVSKEVQQSELDIPNEKELKEYEKPAEEKQTELHIKKEEPKKKEIKKLEKYEKKEKPLKEQLNFEDRILDFFSKNSIEIVEEKMIKKNKEMNYTSRVNSNIGKLDYFIKVKNKSKINEADLSIAFNEAGKMPLLFISNGSLTKKAEEHLSSILKGAIFKKL